MDAINFVVNNNLFLRYYNIAIATNYKPSLLTVRITTQKFDIYITQPFFNDFIIVSEDKEAGQAVLTVAGLLRIRCYRIDQGDRLLD